MNKRFTKVIGMLMLCVLSVVLTGSRVADAEEAATVVGISDFTTEGAAVDQQWIGNSCIDAITVKIGSRKNVKIVERKYLSKVIEELKLQASGLVDENTAVEIGNLVAVKYFIFGSASVAGDNLVLRARIVDVATSKVVFTNEAAGTLNDIFKLQNQMSQQIATALSLGKIEMGTSDAAVTESLPYTVASRLEKIKKLAEPLPFFMLDPARKRKASEYLLVLNMCDDLIEKYPGLQKAHYYKGLFSIQADDMATADVETKEAKRLNSNDVDGFLARAFYFYVSEKYEEARQILDYAATRFPGDSRIWYALSKVNMNQSNTTDAIENLINAMNYAPILPIAETNLRSLVTSVPFFPTEFSNLTYYNIALLYKTLYGTKGVINNNTYSIAQQTAQQTGRYAIPFYIMGVYELNQGKNAEASSNFSNAIKVNPTFSEAHREMGVLLLSSGECFKGRQHITLYVQSNNAVTDFSELQIKMKNCK